MKKRISLLLALVLTLSMVLSVSASAASWPSLSSSSYCEFVAPKTINVYTGTNLSTRGTSSPAKRYNAYIDKGDVCKIFRIDSNYLHVAYPTSSGYKQGYIKRSDVFGVSSPSESFTASKGATTYRYAGSSSYGSVAKGDAIYKAGTSGNYTLVIYTAKSGSRAYKAGWVKTSDFNNMKPKSSDGTTIYVGLTNNPTVRSGSTGSAVKTLQTLLNKVTKANLAVDGVCGAKTVAEIKYFQKAMGLTADGICGKQTWAKLEAVQSKIVVVVRDSSSTSNSSSLLFPLKGSITRSSSVTTNGYYCDYKTGGSKPVYAPADGVAVYKQAYRVRNGKKVLSSYGNYIEFKSSDNVYAVKLCHLSSFNGVTRTVSSSLAYPCSGSDGTLTLKTRTVKRGELLGYTGMTGNASGHHLHLEVTKNGRAVNPTSVFKTW